MAFRARTGPLAHLMPTKDSAIEAALPSPGSPRRIAALDGVRGLAILLVLLRHSVVFGDFSPQSQWDAYFNAGAKASWVGVDLFFVLSGFLITGILYETRQDRHYFRTFYIRRTLRIVPVYYGFLLWYFLTAPLVIPPAEAPALSSGGLAWAASYASNYPTGLWGWGVLPHPVRHVWSLAIEEQFYLVWPLLIYRLPRERLMVVCLVVAGLGWALRAFLVGADLPIAGYVWTPARLGPLALGGWIALAARNPNHLRRISRAAWPAGLTMLGLVVGLLLWRRDLSYTDPIIQLIGFDAVAVLFAALIVLAVTARPGSLVGHLVSLRGLGAMGRYSYAIYLFHQPLILALRGAGLSAAMMPPILGSRWPGALAFALVATGASLAVALLSWHLWEKHFLRLKARFAYG